jgi:16S rRNA (guanine527-N7)-methyltransferase
VIGAIERAAGRPVSRETFDRLQLYANLLISANKIQNLVSRGTLECLWDRHILDSAQLVRFETYAGASWIDIGSGPGLPGIVLACLVDGPVTLVEPRRLRAQFLEDVVSELGLKATVRQVKAERLSGSYDLITGRAVALLSRFLGMCDHLSTKKTVWVLPKGRSAQSELAEAQQKWQGDFRVEPSVTDEDSRIIVATKVRARKR